MKQREPLPTQRKVALFLALGVFLAWSVAVVQYTITRRASDPRVDSAGEVAGGSPSPSSLSSAAPSALARQAASQAVKAYQQALQTIPSRSGPVPPPVIREVSNRLPLPQVPFPWTAAKPALVVEPGPSDTKPEEASSQPSRSLRLTLPYQVFANPQAASEAAQLIARQLVEQGYRPTLVISGTGESERAEAPVNTSAKPGTTRIPSPPKSTSPAEAKGNTSLPSQPGNPLESSRNPAPPPTEAPSQGSPSHPSPASQAGSASPSSSSLPLQDLLATLRQAVAAEFRAYRALPDLQTEELAIYFTGPAYQSVLAQLQTFKATGQILSNPGNPSFSRFQGIVGAVSIEGDTATVTGREGRALHWYIPTLQSYAPHTGQRQYISYQYRLQRQEGRWKIFQRVRL